jgi:hypothetical protein
MVTSPSTRSPRRARPTIRAVGGGLAGLALAATLFGAMGAPAGAISDAGTTTANVGVESGITLTGLTASFTLSGTPGATVTGDGVVEFNVETNNVAGYAVTVQSQSEAMVPTLPGNTDTIPIAALTVREGSDDYQDVSEADPVTVHTQDGRSLDGGDSLSNDYQIRVPVVNADTYSATLDYVATTL